MDLVSGMHLLNWKNQKKTIINEQQYLFNNSIACDCILVSAEGKVSVCHKLILSSASEFFRKLLLEVPAASEPTIHIPDADSNVLEAMLKFIYTGETNISISHLTDLLELCELLSIKGVITNGCNLMRGEIKIEKPIKTQTEATQLQRDVQDNPVDDEYYEITADEPEMVVLPVEGDGEEEFDVEYLYEDSLIEIKDESVCLTFDDDDDKSIKDDDLNESNDEASKSSNSPSKRKKGIQRTENIRSQINEALNEVQKGDRTIHRLSVEYNVPRSTLYHHFRNNEHLKRNYRSERKKGLEDAVNAVLYERTSLKKASDKFHIPKTAIWREVRKYEQYQPSNKEITEERLNAQQEILEGKSLTAISAKYGIPMTTLHRDKKRLSIEGKLLINPVRDRTENSEYKKRLEMALQKCKEGMSQYQAAKLYQIPKATMWRYAHCAL